MLYNSDDSQNGRFDRLSDHSIPVTEPVEVSLPKWPFNSGH